MGNLFQYLKKFSKEVAGATKYFHYALWGVLFLLMLVIALNFSTDFPRKISYRLGIGVPIWAGLCSLFSLLFWYLPKKIVEKKKQEGKDWHGVLLGADLLLAKLTFNFFGLIVLSFFVIHVFSESWVQPPTQMFGATKEEKQVSFIEKQKEFEAYLIKAKQGDLDCQNKVGYAYRNGKGVAKDQTRAFEWYKKAADQGYAKAQYNVGRSYMHGGGCPKDPKKGIEWYKKAADQGYVSAQYNLGHSYMHGEGVPKDYKKSFEWYKKAVDQGDAKAQFQLARFYEEGNGCEVNKDKALHYYTLAAEQGHATAQNRLMMIYFGAAPGIWKGRPYNEEGFFHWATKAADNGQPYAAYLLGSFFSYNGQKNVAIPFLQFAAFKGKGSTKVDAIRYLRNYGRNFEGTPLPLLWALIKGGKKGFLEYKDSTWK